MHIVRAKYLKNILFAGLFFCAHGFAQQKPNIIFILTDDQGYGDIGAFFQNQRAKGNNRSKPFERSPHIDQLAASGAMLMQDYSSAPVCAPSRASLMLGLSQGHSNVRNNQFDKALEDNYTMPSTLHTLGYTTIAIGKWGLQGDKQFDKDGDQWPARPTKRGFDHFFGYMRHVDGHEHYPKEALYYNKKTVEVWDNEQDITDGLDKCYTPDLWTAYAKKWITEYEKGSDKDKPFFMYLAYETPHAVLELPTQQYPAGGGLHGGIQWTGKAGSMINTASGTPDSWVHPDYANATYDHDSDPATPELPWPDTYKRYATANRRIDDGVGDLMQLLKDLKVDDNTLVVYTSDNGPSIESYLPKTFVPNHPTFFDSYGPFDGIKRDTWEGGMRMPTIAVWPGHIKPNTKIELPTISYDWAATFTNAAGMPAPARMDGVSLLPVLTGIGVQIRKPLYTEYYEGGRTPDFAAFAPAHRNRSRNQMQWIRLGDYAGVRYNVQSKADDFEIYDVVKDPGQRTNLANDKGPVAVFPDGKNQKMSLSQLQQEMKDRALQMRRPNDSAPRPYDSAPMPATLRKEHPVPGLRWEEYRGDFPWLPQVEGIPVTESGYAAKIELPANSTGNGVLYFTGYITVPSDGEYTFYLSSGAKALLRLHDATVIDADYHYTADQEYKASVYLQAGLHPFKLYFALAKGAGRPILDLEWSGPGILKQPVAAGMLSRESR